MSGGRYAAYVERNLDVRMRSDDGEWVAVCPFHADTRPSLSINVDSGLWLCFSCGAKGNMVRLQRHFGGQPVEYTLDGLDRSLADLERPPEDVCKRPVSWLAQWPMTAEGAEWLDARGITAEDRATWRLGWDVAEQAVTIPLWALDGEHVLGVIRRKLRPAAHQPKYRYPAGFRISHYLFGAHRLVNRDHIDTLVLVEGSLDAMRVRRHHVAAVLGSSVSPTHVRLLRVLAPKRIVLAFDNDPAGRHAVQRAIRLLRGHRLVVPTAWHERKDPGDMTDDEIDSLVESSISALDWVC